MFLVATIALLLTKGSAISANTASTELEVARAEYVARAGMQHALWQKDNYACAGDLTIPTTAFGAHSYTATLDSVTTTSSDTFNPDRDAWIKQAAPDDNFGNESELPIKNKAGDSFRALYHFDTASIPAGATVQSATAWFYVTMNDDSGEVGIHPATATWAEGAVTWNNIGTDYNSAAIGGIPPQTGSFVWVPVSVTGLVQQWVNDPTSNHGFMLIATSSDRESKYSSREYSSSLRPYLEVTTSFGEVSPVQVTATGTLANGVTRTLVQPQVVAYQTPVVDLFRPDAADSEDAEIWDQGPNNNYGDAAEAWVSSASNDTTRTLLRFNMGAIPAQAKVLEATLSLYRQSGSGADQPVSAHRIVNSWNEASVTWNRRETGTNWDTAGGDFDSTAVVTTPVGPANERYEWNITQLAQGWVDGSYPNYGVALAAGVDGMPGERFYTSDQADPDRRPSLVVTYACECGMPCLAPRGAGNVLMVIGNPPGNPSADEVAMRDYLESWGYNVSMIQDDDSQGNYNTAIAANDVVFVSETVSGSNVGTKLTNASIGVVTAERNLVDELGIATTNNTPVDSVVEVVDNNHFITAVFSLDTLQLKTVNTQLASVGGTVSPDARILATVDSMGGLVALDAGATMSSGGTAAGRRVLVPIGEGNVSWNYLTNSGRLLIQRSLDWGRKADLAIIGNLLMVVGNDGSLTAQEATKKTLIESWGYAVNVIDEDDNQSAFDTALTAADVVFVTEDVNAGDVGSKLTAATIGVVTEEANLSDDLGLATGLNWSSGTDVLISDNSHYITLPFALGSLTILSSVESLAHVIGTQSPDLGELALNQSGLYGLVTLAAGATTHTGGAAAGRRAMLPWGGNDMDVNHLTVEGLTIFQRAIEWATGACAETNSLLLVVGDAANPSSKDSGWQSQLGEWCYQVTLIDDGESQFDLETAAAANDVVYVSGTSSPATLSDKLADVPTPLVNEPMWLMNDFGFSEDEGYSTTYSGFLVSDASHYIPAPFGGGAITIFTENRLMGTLHGTISGDLKDLGGFAATSALAALEIGGLRWDGSPAPARRLQVPFENAEIGQLTTDGLAMLRRSIDWAAGAGPYQGPVAHWKLDETSGTTAVDTVGGHDGTLVNGPTWETGLLDGGLNFDGSNDFVNVPHDDNLSLTDAMTLTAWINASSFGASYQTILAKDAGGAGSNYWFGTWQQLPVFGFFSGGLFREVFNPSFELQPDAWYHLAASFDNATGDTNIYVDGTLIQNGQLSQDPTAVTADLRIGRSPDGERWRGKLDDVRIYDSVLDAAEIAELATPAAIGPVAHWKLDDGTGVTAVDSIGGHDGTLINGPAWVAGQIGDALDFDGSNDLVSVPHQAVFTQAPMTVSAWFKLNTLPTTRSEHGTIVDKRHTVDPWASWTLYVNETLGNKIRFQIRDSSETGYYLDSAASAVANTWYHVVGTIDESYNAKLYVNGALEPDDDNIGSLFSSNDEIRIGAGWSGGNRLDGVVDDVRFYDRALGAAEISGLYTAGTGGGGGGGGGGCNGPFNDTFDAVSYSGGSANWATNWQETGETTSPSGGDIRIDDDVSDYQLLVRDDGQTVWREADLSAATSATLSFIYRRQSLSGSGDYVAVDVSYDGGSNWVELDRFTGTATDSSYLPYSKALDPNSLSDSTRIRFRTPTSGMSNNTRVWFDNIEISCSP